MAASFKRRLKPDAIPDVPLLPDNDIKDGERLTIPSRRGAFEKRRKAEDYVSLIYGLSVAALHYNENCERQQAIAKNGEQYFSTSYPKAKKGTVAVAKPRKTPPTFDYVMLIKQALVERRQGECTSYSAAQEDLVVVNNHLPVNVTTTFTPFRKDDLIQRHRSRFNRQ